MNDDLIIRLIHEVQNSDLTALTLTQGEATLQLTKAQPVASHVAAVTSADPVSVVTTPAGTAIEAPLVGIVYLAGEPGAAPFKQVGDRVEAGEVVCIIESMKMMNEITSHVAGVVTAISVSNESLVAYHQRLMTIEEDTNA